jgi:hypothetical protein
MLDIYDMQSILSENEVDKFECLRKKQEQTFLIMQ